MAAMEDKSDDVLAALKQGTADQPDGPVDGWLPGPGPARQRRLKTPLPEGLVTYSLPVPVAVISCAARNYLSLIDRLWGGCLHYSASMEVEPMRLSTTG